MGIETWIGLIGVVFGGLTLVLSIIILPRQIYELRRYRNVRPFRWTLLIINMLAILTVVSPIWGAVELLIYAEVSPWVRLVSSISVRIFFLAVVVGMFLMHKVFNRNS